MDDAEKHGRKFREALLEAVDEGMRVLGEGPSQAIWYHIERIGRVRRNEIPEKIEAFHDALQGIMGVGAKIIEKQIAKVLYSRLGLNFEERIDWSLMDYMRNAEQKTKNCPQSCSYSPKSS